MNIGVYESTTAGPELKRWINQYCELFEIEPVVTLHTRIDPLLSQIEQCKCDVVFLSMDGPDGFLKVRQIRERYPSMQIVFLTDTSRYAVSGVRLHLTDYIVKPVEFKKVARALRLAGVGGNTSGNFGGAR